METQDLDPQTFWTIFALVAGVIAVSGVVQWVRYRRINRRKSAQFSGFAKHKGWHYTEFDRSTGAGQRFSGGVFGTGGASHVLTGEYRGQQIIAFECSVSSGSGEHSSSTTYTVAALHTPASRPTLAVTREGVGRKMLGFVGVRDLQVGDEKFDRTFRVKTEDERFAQAVLHPEMVQWLLDDGRALMMPFSFEEGDLFTWEAADIDTPIVMRMLGFVCDVFERVPSVVWKS